MDPSTLTEAPETDIDHTSTLTEQAAKIRAVSEALEEYISTCIDTGIDPAALGPLDQAVSSLAEAAMAVEGSVAAFGAVYEGIIDTVESGVSIPGTGGGQFFDRGRS